MHLKIKNLQQKDNQFSDRDSPVSNLLSVSVSLMKEGLMEWKKNENREQMYRERGKETIIKEMIIEYPKW